MNILIIPYYQIYPVKTGASIAQLGTISYLSRICNISLLLPEDNVLSDGESSELRTLLPSVKLYTVQENFVPASKNNRFNGFIHRAFSKVKFLIKKVFSRKKEIKVEKPSSEDEFFQTYSWNPYTVRRREYVGKINEIILKEQIDIVQLEFVENLSLVAAIPPSVKKVFVQHECKFYRIESHINAKKLKSSFTDYIYSYNKLLEMAFIEKFDGILTFNEADSSVLRNELNSRNRAIKLLTCPYPIFDQDFEDLDRASFHHPTKLIFVGPEIHFPNKDAVEWFLEETAVEIFKQFNLRLYVVGEWSQETVEKYKDHPSGVRFTGFIKDLKEFSKDSISIAPVRIGSGLRTKIMLAMAQGIPVVCTEFAVNGIGANHLESVMIANNKDEFCNSIKHLLTDLDATFMICKNAQEIMRTNYSESVASNLRFSFYSNLLEKYSN